MKTRLFHPYFPSTLPDIHKMIEAAFKASGMYIHVSSLPNSLKNDPLQCLSHIH